MSPRRLLAAVALAALTGCGAELSGDVVDGGGHPDGAICSIGVAFTPAEPIAGQTVLAEAAVPDAAGQPLTYLWSIRRDDASPVAFDELASDARRISFVADERGTYHVDLGVGGSGCRDFQGEVYARDPDAIDRLWRLRVVPPMGTAAPVQEQLVLVPGGADFPVSPTLDPGAVIAGTIVDAQGAGVPAYLRLTPTGTPDLSIDGFAGLDGSFAVRLTLVRHDLLIVPFRPDLAPRRLASWLPQAGPIVVDAGGAVTGSVLGPGQQPVVDAAVIVRIGGIPSSVGITDAAGGFTVRARPAAGAPVRVEVVPPREHVLPRLVSAEAPLGLAAPLAVRYDAALTTRDVAGAIARQAGTPAPGALVTFVGALATAGTVSAGGVDATASGSFAVPVLADGSGVLPAARVPAVAAEVVIAGPAGVGTASIDLRGEVPATIDVPAGAAVTGRIVGPDGAPVPGADLRAVPTGALAAAGAAEEHASAAADGQFGLLLAGGGRYELVARDRRRGAEALALRRVELAAVASGGLGDLALPAGLGLSGVVRLAGSPLVGAAVTVYAHCEECPAIDRQRPVAEAATDGSGRFRAVVVDPGIGP
jgi:hypothetical protein